jgi:hypothetical protein
MDLTLRLLALSVIILSSAGLYWQLSLPSPDPIGVALSIACLIAGLIAGLATFARRARHR